MKKVLTSRGVIENPPALGVRHPNFNTGIFRMKTIDDRQVADAVLLEHYEDYGINYCCTLTGYTPKYLRARVQKLHLRLSKKGIKYVNRTKHRIAKLNDSGYEPRSRNGAVMFPDKLSKLELLALCNKS